MTPYYQDDLVTIYHGDALDVLPSLGMVDLVLTDPPFFMPAQHYAARSDWQKSWGDTAILAGWWGTVLDATIPRLHRTGNLLTFCDDESYPVLYPPLYRRFDRLNALVWDKGAIGMGAPWRHTHELIIAARWADSKWTGGGGQSDVLRVKTIQTADRHHPVDKPTELLRLLIGVTTAPGDSVLDPFLGGGSTLVAAKEAGRKAIGIEIEERYCENRRPAVRPGSPGTGRMTNDELLDRLRTEVRALLRDRGDDAWDTVARLEVLEIIDRLQDELWDPPHEVAVKFELPA